MRNVKSRRVREVRKWPAVAGAAGLALAFMTFGTVGGAALAAPPAATQPSVEDLMQKINDLQAQVQQLKQTQQQQQVLSAKEVDDTVDRVLRDADRRSQLLQDEGFTAGWDKGRFFLKSSDGNFLLRPTFQLQIRDGTTFRDHQQPGGGDDTQSGFELRCC